MSMLEALQLFFDRVTISYMRQRGVSFDMKVAAAYRSSLRWSTGYKYILLSYRNRAFGFVVLRDDSQLSEGDLLKSSSGNPSRKRVYGNIFRNPDIGWTSEVTACSQS